MPLERRRPLPAGRYWLDVFDKDRRVWETWSTAMKAAGRLKITHTESFAEIGDSKEHDFVIFETDAETVFFPEQLGSPNIAGKEIQSSDDTLDRPDPMPDPIDQISQVASSAASGAKTVLTVGLGVAVVAALVAIFRRR
jgi:hypothetical protein